MKTRILTIFSGIFFWTTLAYGFQTDVNKTKKILLDLLKSTHTNQGWFSTMNTAVAGLTSEQAAWSDEISDHSVGELTYHLAFWNERLLNDFMGVKQDEFKGENTETFDKFQKSTWEELVKKLDDVNTRWEKAIEAADEAKLERWYVNIANMSAHNAYHTGQIVYLRKSKGWWDPDKGVK